MAQSKKLPILSVHPKPTVTVTATLCVSPGDSNPTATATLLSVGAAGPFGPTQVPLGLFLREPTLIEGICCHIIKITSLRSHLIFHVKSSGIFQGTMLTTRIYLDIFGSFLIL